MERLELFGDTISAHSNLDDLIMDGKKLIFQNVILMRYLKERLPMQMYNTFLLAFFLDRKDL